MASITKLDNIQDTDTQYFIYEHSRVTTFTELKKYIQSYGYSIINSEDLYEKAREDIGTTPSATVNNVAKNLAGGTVILDLSASSYKVTGSALSDFNTATGSAYKITESTADLSAALVIQHNNDYYNLLERKHMLLKDNTLTSYNQEIALKYIFCFFLIISIYTFATNVEKLNLTHVIIYIFFLIYIFYHKSVSNYLLSSFKTSFYELKVATTATQIITYLKIMFFMLLTFLMPLVVFSSVSEEPFIPFMSATDNLSASNVLESTKDMIGDTVETVSEGAKDAAESTSNALGEVTDAVVDNTKTATETVSESLNDAVESAKDAVAPKGQTGGVRRKKR